MVSDLPSTKSAVRASRSLESLVPAAFLATSATPNCRTHAVYLSACLTELRAASPEKQIAGRRPKKMVTTWCCRGRQPACVSMRARSIKTCLHGPSSGCCSCDIYKICSEFGLLPISEEVESALATYEHDWSARDRGEEARQYFLSVTMRQALGDNLLRLQNLVPIVEVQMLAPSALTPSRGCGFQPATKA